ncbi:hypothetical protein GOP47_0005289 [Adiantum capillus-veneris]|uniref:Homologous-pairing protein 2 homolog n=1 Tax=Adiantum capillus-veneris TaxID=13818 RepID=A0A9D4ZP03_ADICA|nr:hypothetical protein GOP47_0005289 [Adiantum capillus-veneris]
MPAKSDSAEGIVLNYMNEQNRPLNVQNVADALQKYGIKKAAVQKVLDSLADSGQVSAKEYGKQKIYLARQDQFEIPSPQELQELNENNEKLRKEHESEKVALSSLEAELRMLESNLTLEQIRAKEQKLRLDMENAESKLETLKQGVILVSAEEREKVQGAFSTKMSEWRKRKKMFKELWDLITESLPRDLKEFKEELGIEYDEDLQVNLQDYSSLAPKRLKR